MYNVPLYGVPILLPGNVVGNLTTTPWGVPIVMPSSGGGFVNALAPIPTQQPVQDAVAVDAVPVSVLTPRISGVANQNNRGGSIPVCYSGEINGGVKMFPQVCAHPLPEKSGNDQFILLLLLVGHGERVISDLKIGEVPIENFAAKDVKYQILPGTTSDPDLLYYTKQIRETALGYLLLSGVNQVATTPDTCDRIAVEISFPAGLFTTNTTTGAKSARTVAVDVEYRKVGDTDWKHVRPNGTTGSGAATYTVTEVANGDYRPEPVIFTPEDGNGQYEVRVHRVTADAATANITDQVTWAILRDYSNHPPINTIHDLNGEEVPLCLIELKIRATQLLNGQLPPISCLVQSKIATSDGTDVLAPSLTANPAWVILDVLTGKANARPLPVSRINLASFKAFADFCDEMGYEYSRILETAETVEQVIRDIASIGQASYNIVDGKYEIVIDRATDQVDALVTARNIEAGSWVDDTTWDNKATELLVGKFLNKNANYQEDEVEVYDDGYSADGTGGTQIGRLRESIQLPGVANAEHLYKLLKYQLRAKSRRPTVYQFRMDWQNLCFTKGAVLYAQHDVSLIGQSSGRVTDVSTDSGVTTLTLDEPIIMEAGFDYEAIIQLQDGSVEVVALTFSEGKSYTIEFEELAGTQPEAGDLVAFGRVNQAASKMRVLAIEHGNDFSATITCADYDPAIYANETEAVPPITTLIETLPELQQSVPSPVVRGYKTDETVLRQQQDGTWVNRIQISLEPPPAVVDKCQYRIKRSDSSVYSVWHWLTISSGAIYIEEVEDLVTYDVQLRYVNSRNRLSAETSVLGITVIGKSTPPPAVVHVRLLPSGMLDWPYTEASLGQPVPKDHAGFRVYVARGAVSDIAKADVYVNLQKHQQFDTAQLPSGAVTVFIVAVDLAGNESEPYIYQQNLGDPPTPNVINTISFAPAFAGTVVNGSESGGWLRASDAGELFWPGNPNQQFWGDSGDLFYDTPWLEMSDTESATLDEMTYGPTFDLSLVLDVEADGYRVEYRKDGGPWSAFPAKVQETPGNFDFRITTFASQTTQGIIKQFDLKIDCPDVIEDIPEFVVPPGGARPTLEKTFRAIDTITFGGKNLTPGTQPIYTDKDVPPTNDGPFIDIIDGSGTSIGGTVDIHIKGH